MHLQHRFLRFAVLFLLLISFITIPTCKKEDEKPDNALLFAAALVILTRPSYVNLANEALAAWQIGLTQNTMASARNLPGGAAANPMNWIAVVDDTCTDIGLRDSIKSSCLTYFTSGSNTIGLCWTSFMGTGEIVESTLVVRRSYLESLASTSRKRNVFTHEIGHCLGLKHTDAATNVMYPTVGDMAGPASGELSAVSQAYVPVQNVSAATRDAYYTTTGANATRHFSFPLFTMSSPSMTVNGALEMPEPGRPFTGPVETRVMPIEIDEEADPVCRDDLHSTR